MRFIFATLAISFIVAASADAQTELSAIRDSGCFAGIFVDGVPTVTENNFGANFHVPVGKTNPLGDRINRSVFDFDIAGNIPGGSVVTAAVFEFNVTQQGGGLGMAPVDFSLHRLTKAWDEGSGFGNSGQVTMDGMTWTMATSSVAWDNPGGDFDAVTSGTVFVDGGNTYQITSSKLVDDVQAIVDGTSDNFGWLLKADPETVDGSAARVTSREGGNPAKLIITFESGGVILGDVNMDGDVNLLDVQPFIDVVLGGGDQAEADVNEDGDVNLLDVQPFIDLVLGNP